MLSCGCRFDEDGPDDGDDVDDGCASSALVDWYFDANGCFTERRRVNGRDVIVHFDDNPETDITTVDGIPCTTALRTVIDLAPEVDAVTLQRMVRDCLERGLLSVEDAHERLASADMATRQGAELLRRVLP